MRVEASVAADPSREKVLVGAHNMNQRTGLASGYEGAKERVAVGPATYLGSRPKSRPKSVGKVWSVERKRAGETCGLFINRR